MSSVIGERASVKVGARYGGKGFARGAFIPKYLIGSIVTIDEVQEGKDGTECHLAELQCWVPVKYLNFLEQRDYVKPPPHKSMGCPGQGYTGYSEVCTTGAKDSHAQCIVTTGRVGFLFA